MLPSIARRRRRRQSSALQIDFILLAPVVADRRPPPPPAISLTEPRRMLVLPVIFAPAAEALITALVTVTVKKLIDYERESHP